MIRGTDANQSVLSSQTELMRLCLCLSLCWAFVACQPLSTRKNSSASQTPNTKNEKAVSPSNDDTAVPTANSLDTTLPSIRKKLPTLREQMERLQSQQDYMNTRLDSVQTELRAIREKVNESLNSAATRQDQNGGQEITKGDAVREPARELPKLQPKLTPKKKTDTQSGVILPDNGEGEQSAEPTSKTAKATPIKKSPKSSSSDIINPDEGGNEADAVKAPRPKIRKKTAPSPAKQRIEPDAEPKIVEKSERASKAQPTQGQLGKKESKEAPATATPAVKTEQPGALFTTAMTLFSKRQYQESIDVLTQDMAQEKSPENQVRAQYWIGESYYGLGKYDEAINSFNKVIKSNSPEKTSKALSMIAESQIRMGKTAEAKKTYQKLQKQYPQTEEAVRAAKRLQQL